MPVDSTFFPHYDDLCQSLSLLEAVEPLLDDAQRELRRAQDEWSQSQAELLVLEQFCDEQQTRIELVRTHCVYGSTALQPQLWLRGGTQGKIRRAQAKLETAQQQKRPLVALLTQLQEERGPLQARVERLEQDKLYKTFLQECISQMRGLAVEINPSRTFRSLQQQIQSQQALVTLGTETLATIGQLVELCGQAKDCYQKAQEHLQEARNLNRTSTLTNRTSRTSSTTPLLPQCASQACPFVARPGNSYCCDRCSTTPHRHGRRCQRQRHPQGPTREEAHARVEIRRERVKQKARDEFQKGVDMLKQALLTKLPSSVKAHYPALCHPLERTAALDFRAVKNGDVGLERTGQELWENATALLRQVQQDLEVAKETLHFKEAAMEDEKDRVIQDLRLQQAPSATAQVVTASRTESGIASASLKDNIPLVVAHPVVAASMAPTDIIIMENNNYPRDPPNTTAPASSQLPNPSAPSKREVTV